LLRLGLGNREARSNGYRCGGPSRACLASHDPSSV
jgi:hypothetical protein